MDSDSDQNVIGLTNASSSALARMSPSYAVPSIMSSYLQNNNLPVQAPPVKSNSRVRIERKFCEDITSDNLLKELKEKVEAKKSKK